MDSAGRRVPSDFTDGFTFITLLEGPMKKLYILAALLMASTAAHAGNGISFDVNGKHVRVEMPKNCDSLSCLKIPAPGLSGSDFGFKSKHDDDDDTVAAAKPAPVQSPAPVAQAPAPRPVASAPAPAAAPPCPCRGRVECAGVRYRNADCAGCRRSGGRRAGRTGSGCSDTG